MVAAYSLRIFGPFQLQIADNPPTRFSTQRGQAILAYLLLKADHLHSRAALAELLWPDLPEKQSRQNLRQTLSRMRRDLEAAGLPDPISGDYHTLRVDASRFTVDALRFGALLTACKAHAHAAVERCPHCAEQLRQAVDLYNGELLAGLNIDDSPAFEEWLLLQRETFHRQAVSALQTLIAYHRDLRVHAAVRGFAEKLIGLEPYQESAYIHLIEALALLGDREAALAQYERCVTMLTDELGVAPSQRLSQLSTQLRQQGAAERLVEAIERDRPQPGVRHHFPQFLVPFFGREEEISQIVARLADPTCRLFTVTGPGGMGKSRLLVEVAQRLNPLNYPDGLYFVPLAAISEPEGVLLAIADALSLSLTEGAKIQGQVMRRLASLRLLLVLDNFEHLLDAVPLVMEILEKAPGVSCLVSSRQPLQIQAEWRLPLDGLDYPTDGDDPRSERYSAVAFFLERARRLHPNFEPSTADLRAIVEICRLVNGMPLAITMAAAWLSIYDCAAIAAQIGQSLDFFAVPLRDLPPRHQSMRAAFEVSWRLLPPATQQTLARLSIFVGAFSHDAVLTVTAASPLDLARLVTHSLLMRVAANRYTLHELLRQFAAEKLVELDQSEKMSRAHARYYLARLASTEKEMLGAAQIQAIERLTVDLPNLRAAWLAAAADRQWGLVGQSLKALERYWLATGRQHEGQTLLHTAARALAEDLAHADEPMNGSEPTLSPAQERQLLARLKLAQGHIAYIHTPWQESINIIHSALSLAEDAAANADLIGEIHLTLSLLYHHQGLRSQVEHHLNEAYARLHHSTDAALQARLYLELSGLAGQQGDQAQRRAHLEHAMTLAEQSGDLTVDFMVRRYLTHMQMRLGEYSQVCHHIDRLLHNADLVKNESIRAHALNLYAGYYFYMGDFEKMASYNAQAFPLLQKTGGVQHLSIYAMRQGLHALMVGNWDQAIEQSCKIIEFARRYHHRDLEALALMLLGRAQTKASAFDAGWQAFAQAMHLLDQHGRSMDYLTAVVGQGSILLAQGNAPAALEQIEPVLSTILTDDLGIVVDYGHIYADAYHILHACADPRAGDLWARAYAVLSRVANTIPEAALRHSFWHSNPSHRLILLGERSRMCLQLENRS